MNRSAAMLNFFDSTKSKITASVRHLLITHPLGEYFRRRIEQKDAQINT